MGEADDIIGSDAGEETREALERRREALTRWRPSKPRPERPRPRARRARRWAWTSCGATWASSSRARQRSSPCARGRRRRFERRLRAGGKAARAAGRNDAQDHRRVRPCRFRESRHRGVDAQAAAERGGAHRARRENSHASSRRGAPRLHGGGACKAPPRAVRLPARRPPRGSGEDQNRQRVRAAP